MLFVICILTCLQAYVMPWIIPSYEKTGIAAATDVQHVSQGFTYLAILAVALIIMSGAVLFVNKRK